MTGENGPKQDNAVESPESEDGLLARLSELSKDDLMGYLRRQHEAGVRINFTGKSNARQIARKVQPRVVRRVAKYSAGPEDEQARNLLIEGENLQAMATLYRERGQVDLVLADPPYNTGNDFRYNDKWDEDPNDPDLGDLVPENDGARHTKWMKFMWPRLQIMKDMLKPAGVLAICIDHRELFHLGQMLDELFRESNRIAVINWQRAYTPRNDSAHVSVATEYVLVYAKDLDRARTSLLPRPEDESEKEMADGDPRPWTDGPATGSNAKNHKGMVYAIQSPFTGELLYPPSGSAWRYEQKQNLQWLREWGAEYKAETIDDAEKRSQTIGVPVDEVPEVKALLLDEPMESAQLKARQRYEDGLWPRLYFLKGGMGRPRFKKYLDELKQGFVPTTFWDIEDYELPIELGSVSWRHKQSGHGEEAVDELTAVVGPGHNFKTVKPLKLFQKIIHLWCPPDGLVLDPFAGSGTTGHAVLKSNHEAGTQRRFILIEQGRPEKGDAYARSLCADRMRRVVTGKWHAGEREPLNSGFRFAALQNRVDAKALLSMARDEMADAVIASHFDDVKRGPSLVNMVHEGFEFLVAKNSDEEGFFLVWDGSKEPPVFTEAVYDAVVGEALKAELKPMYHVYARFNLYQSEDVIFYQIPNRILMDFGISTTTDAFHDDEAVVPIDLD